MLGGARLKYLPHEKPKRSRSHYTHSDPPERYPSKVLLGTAELCTRVRPVQDPKRPTRERRYDEVMVVWCRA